MSTPDGAELDVDVVENADGTFDIYYTAPEPGKYVITIRFGGEHIPNSPFHVVVSNSPRRTTRAGFVWCVRPGVPSLEVLVDPHVAQMMVTDPVAGATDVL